MKTKFSMAVAAPAIFLSLAGQSWAESQPAPGTFAIEQYIISQTVNCPLTTGHTFHGVAYDPGPNSLGATMRISRNDSVAGHWTIINNLPRSPNASPGAVWTGGFTGFTSPPLTPLSGTLNATTTMTWIDASTYIVDLNTTVNAVPGPCQTHSRITGWRTNLNQAPQN